MAETQKILVSNTAWTDVSGNIKQGYITNNSFATIRYRIAMAQPDPTDDFGRFIHPQEERFFCLEGSEKLWAIGLNNDAKIALTKAHTESHHTKSLIAFDDGPALDAFSRQRTAEPFGIFDNKNVVTRNKNQWLEVADGIVLTYNTLVGTFQNGEEIRGLLPTGSFAIGIIASDNGTDTMTVSVSDNMDFQVGDTITGQTSGATATIVSNDTGSNIQYDFDLASIELTTGLNATDRAIRQTYLYHAYVPGKSQLVFMTFVIGTAKANVLKRVGIFDDFNGLFLEQNGTTDTAFVVRTNTSGSAVDNRIPQDEWNLDTLDGNGPSGVILDLTKTQIFMVDFQWLGVGRVRFGFDIDGTIIYAHEQLNANNLSVVYMRSPSLPLRYEIANTAVQVSQSSMHEICCSVGSEGGYALPGLEFSTPVTWANQRNVSVRTPVLAIRLKNEFPAGKQNRRTIKYIDIGAFIRTNDAQIEIAHVHDPVDITATWNDVGGGSAAEYSTDITTVTGRPEHIIDQDTQEAGGGIGKGSSTILTGEFISLHSFLSQNFDSSNSQMFVVYVTPRTGSVDVLSHITWIEFD